MKVLKAAVVGRSLTHSISPEVHKQIFPIVREKCDSDFDGIEYSKVELPDEESFFSFVHEAHRAYRGFNITFPYKFSAANLEGDHSERIDRIHSANTLLNGTPIKIISTDGLGFLFSLQKTQLNFESREYSLIIIGAGGAARAVLDIVSELGWKTICIAARSLPEAIRSVSLYKNVSVIPIGEVSQSLSRDDGRHFIVQATPVGQRSAETLLFDFAWQTGDIAVDLVYNPLITRFLDIARNGGAAIMDGLGMLIEQASLSQYFWMTGRESDHSVLTHSEYQELHYSLSKFVAPRWDAFAM